MPGLMEGQVTIVTGGGSGIGRAAALKFAEEGASVAIADLNEQSAEETRAGIEAAGGEAMAAGVDVRDQEAVGRFVQGVVDRFGGLDSAFNNAGITGTAGPVHECDAANWENVIGTNVTGIYNCMHAELAVLVSQGRGGSVVNMSSNVGHVGVANMPAYVTSKTAILGLTRAAAIDYARYDIRVNALCPGVTMTEMAEAWYSSRGELGDAEKAEHASRVMFQRHAKPAEIAEGAAWLCSPRSSYATGSALRLDGGWTAW